MNVIEEGEKGKITNKKELASCTNQRKKKTAKTRGGKDPSPIMRENEKRADGRRKIKECLKGVRWMT